MLDGDNDGNYQTSGSGFLQRSRAGRHKEVEKGITRGSDWWRRAGSSRAQGFLCKARAYVPKAW
jgi:hypothetical protein